MSGFVASVPQLPESAPAPSSPSSAAPAQLLEFDGWWPAIDLGHMRAAMRIGDVVTDPRLTEAAKVGMITVGRELRSWKADQVAAGAASLEAVEADAIDFESVLVASYRRAVYSYAAAELAETHRDISATSDGSDRAEVQALSADEHRRNGIYSIRDILDVDRIDAELI